jgi:uncharacterized membrane protein
MKNTSKNLNVFRALTLATLGSLVLEFVLGIYNALFVQFPDTLVDGNGWAWSMKSSPVILAHVILGSLLVLLTVATVIFGFASRSKPAIVWSVAGLVLTILAYMSGSVFLADISQDNYSFLMALGFMGSLLSYAVAFYLTRLPASLPK